MSGEWADGYFWGALVGYQRGWTDRDAEMTASWRTLTRAVRTETDPESWRERVRQAEIGGRRDSAEHWRQFLLTHRFTGTKWICTGGKRG